MTKNMNRQLTGKDIKMDFKYRKVHITWYIREKQLQTISSNNVFFFLLSDRHRSKILIIHPVGSFVSKGVGKQSSSWADRSVMCDLAVFIEMNPPLFKQFYLQELLKHMFSHIHMKQYIHKVIHCSTINNSKTSVFINREHHSSK